MNQWIVTSSGSVSYSTNARPRLPPGRPKHLAFCKLSPVDAGLGQHPGNGGRASWTTYFRPKKRAAGSIPRRPDASDQKPYAHFGSPSLLAGASDVDPTYTAHVLVVVVWDTL